MPDNTHPHARTVESMTVDDFAPESQETVADLQSMYVVSILNPDDKEDVVYSLWYRPHNNPADDQCAEREYQILTSPNRQTGFMSADPSFGGSEMLTLSPEFFRAIRRCYHSMASMSPTTYFQDMKYTHHDPPFIADLNAVYGGEEQYPDYEAWVIAEIIPFLFTADDAPEELRPLGEWIAELTKWPIPSLNIDDKFDDE